MAEAHPLTGSWFLDHVFLPYRERKIDRTWSKIFADVTYRRPHNYNYGGFRTPWELFKMGSEAFCAPHSSVPDMFWAVSKGMRAGGIKSNTWFLDPVWGGSNDSSLDPRKYDLALMHVAESGPYWSVFLFPEALWRRTFKLAKDVDVYSAPTGLLPTAPSVEAVPQHAEYPWRAAKNRRWPPAHGHH